MSTIKRQAIALVTDTGLRRELARTTDEGKLRRLAVGACVPALRDETRPGVIEAAFDRLVLDRAADVQPRQWAVGAARGLPVVDGRWDPAAAQRRVFELAALDSRSPRFDIVRRAHLVYDRASPHLRDSYPREALFADVVDGRLVASRQGLAAARRQLGRTGAPAAAIDRARAVVDGYA